MKQKGVITTEFFFVCTNILTFTILINFHILEHRRNVKNLSDVAVFKL
jgi:hypothetical protein